MKQVMTKRPLAGTRLSFFTSLCLLALVTVCGFSPAQAATVGNQMPDPSEYQGLSRKVLQYSVLFNETIGKIKQPGFSEADWAPLEALVDTENFERTGVFLKPVAEVIGWDHYKKTIIQYGGGTTWEGTLRRITEVPGLVFLELEERNTRNGVTDVSNTVTIYQFNDADQLTRLHVYVMPLP
jgi:hypothetical protein